MLNEDDDKAIEAAIDRLREEQMLKRYIEELDEGDEGGGASVPAKIPPSPPRDPGGMARSRPTPKWKEDPFLVDL